jgi:thiol-disulfide isomerase/thioredoxin
MNMFSRVACLLVILLFSSPAWAGKKGDIQRSIHRQGSMGLEQLLRNELREAKRERRGIIVMFTADWCIPCKAIKDHLEESAEVADALNSGRVLFIDVDEWRGPAHRLFPGINPTKLPTLVSLDPRGTVLRECKGTELGLLSAKDTANNLGRLLRGLPLEPAKYTTDPTLRTALIRESALKERARQSGKKPVIVEVMSSRETAGGTQYLLRIQLHNLNGMRRWFAISERGGALTEAPHVDSWTLSAFEEHARSRIWRYRGESSFALVPVGGNGSLEISAWTVSGGGAQAAITIWELNRVEVDGQRLLFEKKLPVFLSIKDAGRMRELSSGRGSPKVKLTVRSRHVVPIR